MQQAEVAAPIRTGAAEAFPCPNAVAVALLQMGAEAVLHRKVGEEAYRTPGAAGAEFRQKPVVGAVLNRVGAAEVLRRLDEVVEAPLSRAEAVGACPLHDGAEVAPLHDGAAAEVHLPRAAAVAPRHDVEAEGAPLHAEAAAAVRLRHAVAAEVALPVRVSAARLPRRQTAFLWKNHPPQQSEQGPSAAT